MLFTILSLLFFSAGAKAEVIKYDLVGLEKTHCLLAENVGRRYVMLQLRSNCHLEKEEQWTKEGFLVFDRFTKEVDINGRYYHYPICQDLTLKRKGDELIISNYCLGTEDLWSYKPLNLVFKMETL